MITATIELQVIFVICLYFRTYPFALGAVQNFRLVDVKSHYPVPNQVTTTTVPTIHMAVIMPQPSLNPSASRTIGPTFGIMKISQFLSHSLTTVTGRQFVVRRVVGRQFPSQ